MSKMVLLTFVSNVWQMCVNHSTVFTLCGTSPVPDNNKVAVSEGNVGVTRQAVKPGLINIMEELALHHQFLSLCHLLNHSTLSYSCMRRTQS